MVERLTATFGVKDAKGVLHEVTEMTAFEASASSHLYPVVKRYVHAGGQLVHRVSDNEFETASGVQLTVVRD